MRKILTTQRIFNVNCLSCGEENIKCPNIECGKMLSPATQFSDWLRKEELRPVIGSSMYDSQNIDYVWHSYKSDPPWIITIEEKRFGARSKFPQTDTHGIIEQMLRNGSQFPVKTAKGEKLIEYRGHYVVSFQKTCPDDSEWIRISTTEFNKEGKTEVVFSTYEEFISFLKGVKIVEANKTVANT